MTVVKLAGSVKYFAVSVGAPVSGRDSVYGSGTGLITLDNVVCNGNEQDLLQCSHAGILAHNCNHQEDAAVVCGSKYSTLSSSTQRSQSEFCYLSM